MSWVNDFKDFAMKGNVVDMAVGVVIGGAFGKVVSSFVENVIMPPIGVLMGGTDFSKLAITLQEAVGETPAVLLNYGAFIQSLVDFLIIAAAIFWVVRGMSKLQKAKEEEPAGPTSEELLVEIRDALKNK
ncbi:MAG: large-conductance mechanosensitive channel protein MscL [Pseudomonadota bacterium]